MIISLRATSGAGKSWVVHQIIGGCNVVRLLYPDPNKRRPLGLMLSSRSNLLDDYKIFVPGHYDIANGGVDTLPNLDAAYELIAMHAALGHHVIYEGKNMSDGVERLLSLASAGHVCRVLHLSTPLGECYKRVRDRGHQISMASMKRTRDKVQRDCDKFAAAGVYVNMVRSRRALELVREWTR